MRALVSASMVALAASVTVACGSEVTSFPSTGGADASGGAGGAGGTATGVTTGPGGQGGSGGGGGEGGAEPACNDFGAPCLECLATSTVCQDSYCGCLSFGPCAQFFQCANQCMGDADCIDACELDDPEGYADFFRVLDCMGEECSATCNDAMPLGGCFDCWLSDCEAPLETCIGDPECNQYIDCLVGCSDPACASGCYTALSDPSLVNALLDCQEDMCSDPSACEGFACQGFGDPCTDCAFAAPSCNDAYCACLSDTTCLGLSQCFNGCPAGDQACNDACELTWFNGYGQWIQMAGCMGDACGDECGFEGFGPCAPCLGSVCEAELEGCLGDADCNEYLDCVGACQTPGCELGCYGAMADSTAADALGACLTASCNAECG